MASQEQEFLNIYNAIGTPFNEGGMKAYIERLKNKTKFVNEYVAWAANKKTSSGSLSTSPQNLLGKLKAVRFSDGPALMSLAQDLHNVTDNIIPLTQDTSRRFIIAPDVGSIHIEPRHAEPGPPFKSSDSRPDSGSHPCIVALSGGDSGEASMVPKYVFPLGRLFWRDIRPIQDIPADDREGLDTDPNLRSYQPTNYAAVVDVTSQAKSVWLIYNRHVLDTESDGFEEQPPNQVPVAFPALSTNFESAQIMTSLRDWDMTKLTPTVGQMEERMGRTKGAQPLTASVPSAEDVAKAFAS